MGDPKLLPCPHCGQEAFVTASSDGYGVECRNLRCSMLVLDEFDDEEDAVDAWNERAATTEEQFAYAVHDGKTWVCVERALESDMMKPIPGFTRDSIYRDSMQEYCEWMEKATELMRDIWSTMSRFDGHDAPIDWSSLENRLGEFGICE